MFFCNPSTPFPSKLDLLIKKGISMQDRYQADFTKNEKRLKRAYRRKVHYHDDFHQNVTIYREKMDLYTNKKQIIVRCLNLLHNLKAMSNKSCQDYTEFNKNRSFLDDSLHNKPHPLLSLFITDYSHFSSATLVSNCLAFLKATLSLCDTALTNYVQEPPLRKQEQATGRFSKI